MHLNFLFSGDPEKQGTLVKQLQEQHYIQYMQQLESAHRGKPQTSKEKSEEESSEVFLAAFFLINLFY